MKLSRPHISIPISISQVIKLVLAISYALICSAIILPQIDHEPWYPEELRTYDLPSGIDFASYREVRADLNPIKLNTSEKNSLIKVIWKRIKASNISDAKLLLDENLLTLRLPAETDSEFIYHLLSGGNVEILKPNDPDAFTENPILAYDQANYLDSGLSIADIAGAEFKSHAEQYSYIKLSIRKESRVKWNTFASEQSTSGIGLFIDGSPNVAWIFAGTGTDGPTLVVPMQEADARVITSLLVENPIPFTISIEKIEDKSRDSSDTLKKLYVLLSGTIAICLLLRLVLLKEKLVSTLAAGLTVLGIVAILKTTSMPVTYDLFVALLLLFSLILGIRTSAHLTLYTLLSVLGLILTASLYPSIVNTGHLFIIAGLFGLFTTFFYEFIEIYEEK